MNPVREKPGSSALSVPMDFWKWTSPVPAMKTAYFWMLIWLKNVCRQGREQQGENDESDTTVRIPSGTVHRDWIIAGGFCGFESDPVTTTCLVAQFRSRSASASKSARKNASAVQGSRQPLNFITDRRN